MEDSQARIVIGRLRDRQARQRAAGSASRVYLGGQVGGQAGDQGGGYALAPLDKRTDAGGSGTTVHVHLHGADAQVPSRVPRAEFAPPVGAPWDTLKAILILFLVGLALWALSRSARLNTKASRRKATKRIAKQVVKQLN